jgi:integrase
MSEATLHLVPPDDGGQERPDASGWLGWLQARLDPGWRPGEWDPARWLFTGDLDSDRTAAWACRTPGCGSATPHHHGRCDSCRRARNTAGVGWEEFDAVPAHRPRHPTRPRQPRRCSVPQCQSDVQCDDLCLRHEKAWRKDTSEPIEEFCARARPLARHADCRVAGCGRELVSRRGLCRYHDQRLSRRGASSWTPEDVAAWVAGENPLLGAHQFALTGLPEPIRTEVLYALQRRDQAPPPLAPGQVRILLSRLDGATSLRQADPEQVCQAGGVQYNSAIRSLFHDLRRHLDRAWTQHTGIDPFAGDVWQVALLDLQANASRRWPATRGVIDFRPIQPAWLREVVKDWARTTRPYIQRLRETLRAVRTASTALAGVGRLEATDLGAGDYTRIIDAIRQERRSDATLYSATHRNLLIYQFNDVIEYGRTAGLMTHVPDTFRPAHRHHDRVREDPNEEELGKALPESVIRQLDAHLHLLGPTGRAGTIGAGDLQAMQQAIYRILRDTGRRPGEVVSLHLDCLEVIDGHHNLIYDNHKAARMRRRLPITVDTAATITGWRARRLELDTPPAQRDWLFPSPLLRAQQSHGHLTPAAVAGAFKAWVHQIATIDSDLLGPDGHPAPFDRSLVVPYALRHSYAQRHADAGVPVDVLKELMDHAAVATTMGYYRISLTRKQQAIRSVGALATDADGNPAPFTDPTAYQRASVSVPFGNCTEPSNVTAGGGACPIRFQCAGCGFYRPDPSYLPALEQHIADLRADRETARAIGVADYVQANLTAEIDAFTKVAETMRRRLNELPSDERADVEDASRLLRRARAGRHLPIIAVTSSGRTG